MTIGPRDKPYPIILHVDSNTGNPSKLAESNAIFVSSVSAITLSATTVCATNWVGIPGGPGTSNHGDLNGLSNNDHPQYVLSATNSSLSSLVSDHLASAVHWDANTLDSRFLNSSGDSVTGSFYFGNLSATNLSATSYLNLPSVTALNGTGIFEVTSYSRSNYVLTSTNLALSNTVTGHLASAVHWDLATLNTNYINASGDSVTGSFFFADLSATNFSATSYLNLPSVTALNGTGAFEVTSYSRSNYVLTSTNLALSNTVTGHLASAVHWDANTLDARFINASGDSVTGSFTFGNVTGTNISATTYLNLPSALATWNASALQGRTVNNTPPGVGEVLAWDNANSRWTPSSVPTGGVTNNPGGSNTGNIQFKNGGSFSGVDELTYNSTLSSLYARGLSSLGVTATNISATTYFNLPSVTALNGTGVFEVTSYSRSNYVLTSTNLALSNTVTGHLASAVHWDANTLDARFINASGDSVTGSFYFGNLSAAVFSATTISATNAYIASTIQFNTGITPTLAVGQMSWNSTDQTLDIQTTVDTTLQIGQEQVMLVENHSGNTIENGKVVYVSGTTGGSGKLRVALASASSINSETAFIIGVATQDIPSTGTGFVTTFGKVNGIPLPGAQFSQGDIAYLGDTPGELRNYKPSKPSHGYFQIGRVIRTHNSNGILFVTIRGSVDMSEIHDVASSTPNNGQVLVWNTASGVYEPKNVSAISGINNYATTASLVLSGLSDTLITSPALSSVLKWNGSKWVPATDQTGGGGGSPGGGHYSVQINDGAGGFYGDEASFKYDYDAQQITIARALVVESAATFNDLVDFTQAITFTSATGTNVSSASISATNYYNVGPNIFGVTNAVTNGLFF
jgi:hypothetical protein